MVAAEFLIMRRTITIVRERDWNRRPDARLSRQIASSTRNKTKRRTMPRRIRAEFLRSSVRSLRHDSDKSETVLRRDPTQPKRESGMALRRRSIRLPRLLRESSADGKASQTVHGEFRQPLGPLRWPWCRPPSQPRGEIGDLVQLSAENHRAASARSINGATGNGRERLSRRDIPFAELGEFVCHSQIPEHEDGGMMARIQMVLPLRPSRRSRTGLPTLASPRLHDPEKCAAAFARGKRERHVCAGIMPPVVRLLPIASAE
jgi:hypothetical protein